MIESDVARFLKLPQGIATPFPQLPQPPGDDDPTLTPEGFVHRPQVAQKGRGAVTNQLGGIGARGR